MYTALSRWPWREPASSPDEMSSWRTAVVRKKNIFFFIRNKVNKHLARREEQDHLQWKSFSWNPPCVIIGPTATGRVTALNRPLILARCLEWKKVRWISRTLYTYYACFNSLHVGGHIRPLNLNRKSFMWSIKYKSLFIMKPRWDSEVDYFILTVMWKGY